MYLSHLSLKIQALILFIVLLVTVVVLYAVIISVSRPKPLSTEFITINKDPKDKKVKLIFKKIVKKLIQIGALIIKKIKRFKISKKAHNKQNDIQKK